MQCRVSGLSSLRELRRPKEIWDYTLHLVITGPTQKSGTQEMHLLCNHGRWQTDSTEDVGWGEDKRLSIDRSLEPVTMIDLFNYHTTPSEAKDLFKCDHPIRCRASLCRAGELFENLSTMQMCGEFQCQHHLILGTYSTAKESLHMVGLMRQVIKPISRTKKHKCHV